MIQTQGPEAETHFRTSQFVEYQPDETDGRPLLTFDGQNLLGMLRVPLILSLLLALALQAAGQTNPNDHWVEGHYRADGTWVNGYRATNPNGTINDNYSTYPNINPYTGERGHIQPEQGSGTWSTPDGTFKMASNRQTGVAAQLVPRGAVQSFIDRNGDLIHCFLDEYGRVIYFFEDAYGVRHYYTPDAYGRLVELP